MTLLAIEWGAVAVKAGQFILSFSIIVVLHEMGHFLPARWFKCRVEKFYLFFNPWFSLFKKKIGETEYGIGWVPFGGYVKISGMVDESMDKEQLKQPPQPWEFRSKPAWQRLIIMVGGVVVNLILGFFIYAMMLWQWGDSYIPSNKVTYGIATDSLARSIGLRDGDIITGLDGQYIDKFSKIPLEVILRDRKTFNVNRDGQQIDIAIPNDFAGKLISHKAVRFISVRVPFDGVDSVYGLAQKADIRVGDKIISVNGIETPFFNTFQEEIVRNREKNVDLVIVRGADTLHKSVVLGKEGLGVKYDPPVEKYFDVKKLSYSFLSAIPAGFNKSVETLESYWLQLKLLFSKKVKTSDSLGSVLTIGSMFSSKWDWESFWGLTAFFSLVLALMNILPIPGLDGGHALFTIYEIVTGRKPSDKFMEYAQMIGMILLLGIMAYALGLDIFRLFK